MKKILFVCTGNTCRSPMAQYLFNDKISTMNLQSDYVSSSCGTNTIDGLHMSDNSFLTLSESCIDASSFRSMPVTKAHLNDAFLVLTMQSSHKNAINSLYSGYDNKIFTLSEFVNESKEISDPYGMPIYQYKKCALQISDLLDKLIIKLEREN